MFPRHGKFSVEIDTNILLVNATGPFNEELVKGYKAALEAAICELSNSPKWGQIIVLEKESLFTPDAEQMLIQSLKYRRLMGLKSSAVVLAENVTGRSLIKQQMSNAYQKSGIEFAFFDDTQAAKTWLREQV